MKPLHSDGVIYDAKTIGSILGPLIDVRNIALKEGRFNEAVFVSHIIAILNYYIQELQQPDLRKLREALEESVKLQSHYAKLLNMYDGGQRIIFKDCQAWLDRLKERKCESERSIRTNN